MMEGIIAFLYTTSFIIKRDGNYDLFYLFAFFLLVYWLTNKKNRNLTYVFIYMLPFALMGIIMVFYPQINYLKLLVYETKIFLCLILMEYMVENYKTINWERLIRYICIVYCLEIVLALFWKTSFLWRLNDLINVYTKTRLKLVYIEPSELSFHCALILVFFMAKFLIVGLTYIDWFCISILGTGMILSAGMGGILAFLISTICMLVYMAWRKMVKGDFKCKKRVLLLVLTTITGTIVLINNESALVARLKSILYNNDYSFYSRFWAPFNSLEILLNKTNWLGCGFGNSSTEYGMALSERIYIFTNSSTTFIAEAGIFAILIIAFFCWKLFKICIETGDVLALGLLVFILVYQIPGGYFTNPINYAIYGIIVGTANTKSISFMNSNIKELQESKKLFYESKV